jgi:2-polyprenyl-6-methoxyphenol hydroxylase-like FAD-dependent oxidoreductase
MEDCALKSMVNYFKHDGELIVGPMPFAANFGRGYIRPKVYALLDKVVEQHGIKVRTGCKVVRYFESEDKGGVELESGEILTADVVAAADGVHSKSWSLVNSNKDEPTSSGHSAYRVSFPIELALKDPLVQKFIVEGNKDNDSMAFMAGPGCHAVIILGRETASYIFLHQDKKGTSSESWSNKVDATDALKTIEDIGGWDPSFKALVAATPKDALVDWRLMWRNPQPIHVSPHGRVVQIGDSCHSFLPTSANGATQAMEDGVSLAACLRLAGGKEGVPLAGRVHNKLRFERVSCGQLMGLMRREVYHKVDWNMLRQNPKKVANPPGEWIARHDPEAYATENFQACADHVVNGTAFKNTNTPPGYEYEPWDVQQVQRDADAGKPLAPAGDWS